VSPGIWMAAGLPSKNAPAQTENDQLRDTRLGSALNDVVFP